MLFIVTAYDYFRIRSDGNISEKQRFSLYPLPFICYAFSIMIFMLYLMLLFILTLHSVIDSDES